MLNDILGFFLLLPALGGLFILSYLICYFAEKVYLKITKKKELENDWSSSPLFLWFFFIFLLTLSS